MGNDVTRQYEPVYLDKDTKANEDAYVQMLAKSALEETLKIYSGIEAAGIKMTAENKKGEVYPSGFKVEVTERTDKDKNPIKDDEGKAVYNISATVKLGKNQDLTLAFKNDNADNPSARLSTVTAANHVMNPKTFKWSNYNITAAKIQDNEYLNDTLKAIAKIACAGLDKEEMKLRGEVSDLKALGIKSAKFIEGGITDNNKIYDPSIEVFAFNEEGMAYKAKLTDYTIPKNDSNGKPNDRAGEVVPVAFITCIGSFAKDDEGNNKKDENGKAIVEEKGGTITIDSEATLAQLESVPAEIMLAVAAHKNFELTPYKEALAMETPAKAKDKADKGIDKE